MAICEAKDSNDMYHLNVVTGAAGVGKSTIVPLLKVRLDVGYAVYDFDEILRPYDGTARWAWDVTARLFQLARANGHRDRTTVVVGLVRPHHIEALAPRYGNGRIRFCLLDVTVEERARRLAARGAPKDLIQDIEEVHGLRTWFRQSRYEALTLDVTQLPPETAARLVAAWIRRQ